MNFVLKDDHTKTFWVLNRSPQKGEPAWWGTLGAIPSDLEEKNLQPLDNPFGARM
jgi:hypothetical protein